MFIFKRLSVLFTALAVVVSALALFAMPAAAAVGPQPLEECANVQLVTEYMDYGNGVQDVAFGWSEIEGAYSYEVYVYDASGKLIQTLAPANGWRWGLLPAAALAEGGPFNVVIVAKNAAGAPLCQTRAPFTFELPAGKTLYDALVSHPGPPVPLPFGLGVVHVNGGVAAGGVAGELCPPDTGTPAPSTCNTELGTCAPAFCANPIGDLYYWACVIDHAAYGCK